MITGVLARVLGVSLFLVYQQARSLLRSFDGSHSSAVGPVLSLEVNPRGTLKNDQYGTC